MSGCVGDVRLGLELPASVDAACNLASSLQRRLTSSDDLLQAGGRSAATESIRLMVEAFPLHAIPQF